MKSGILLKKLSSGPPWEIKKNGESYWLKVGGLEKAFVGSLEQALTVLLKQCDKNEEHFRMSANEILRSYLPRPRKKGS